MLKGTSIVLVWLVWAASNAAAAAELRSPSP